jgi:putative transcriptional regulator
MTVASESESGRADRADVVHNRLAMLRAERRVSRRELADAIGVHYQTVGYLERGEFNPSLHLALRIARFFEVPVEFVFSLDEFARIGPDSSSQGSA